MTSTEIHAEPVRISPEAVRAMNEKVREWTGWRKGTLTFGKTDPKVSQYAMCDHVAKTITVDPEHLILNPNRVLLTVTPFRLRQEAVLTGTILHEAGHARHSKWMPRTKEEAEASPMLHSDDTPPTAQTVALARLMEEARVEALIASEADHIGALGLGWTMRAMAAHLMPMTALAADPAQAIMDLITSWTLRAGRQAGLNARMRGTATPHRLPGWVGQFTSLLHQTIETHLVARVEAGAVLASEDGSPETPNYRSLQIVAGLIKMIECDDDTGPTMIDTARDVLAMLFPETPSDDDSDSGDGDAMPGNPCEGGEGQPNEGTGEASTAPKTGEQDSEGGEPQSSPAEPGDGTGEPEEGESEAGTSESEQGSEQEGKGASSSTDSADEGEPEPLTPTQEALAKALAEMEAACKSQTEDEAEDEAEQAPPLGDPAKGAGAGPGGRLGGSWRQPDGNERAVQKGAEKFLRDMIDASETSKRMITDQPSSAVDGAAMSAWKAGGQVREPHFFVRTKRTVEPSPPIKIAILVDVSSSMDDLQAPSALLSWALASAALDLRNFAGRGQQIESCLIHWGDSVKVIQKPGELIPGIREVPCNQGTSNMHGALDMIEQVMPGFYDTAVPVNRLLVQFTDWKLFHENLTRPKIARALEAGVNMLSVVPNTYSPHWASLSKILQACPIQRGTTSLVKYSESNPGAVWTQATESLNGSVPSAAAALGF